MYYFFTQNKLLHNYSIDNIRVNFELKHDSLINFQTYFSNINRIDIIQYPLCFSDFKYKCMFSINYEHGVLRLGYCFNGVSSDDKLKGFLDFNPNKCMDSNQCIDDLKYLRSLCCVFDLARWDLAIDIPLDRSNVHLVKDRRKYELHEHSYNDRTEYLGVRNTAGRVKLYNKTVESKLDYLLTRLEVTLGTIDYVKKKNDILRLLPEILTIDTQQNMCIDDLKDTDKVLIQLINSCDYPMYYFKQLGRDKRHKLKPYIFDKNIKLEYDYECIIKCCDFIKENILFY